jgi:hypothetical protein
LESIMAKSQYNADSASPPPLSLRPGLPGNRKEDPVKFVSFPAAPVNDTLHVPATDVLAGGANMYVGESAHPGRRLPAHDARDAKPSLSGPSTTTAID